MPPANLLTSMRQSKVHGWRYPMFFKKQRPASTSPDLGPARLVDEEIPESEKVAHGAYAIITRPKMLHNGNWIVRIILEEKRPDGPRQYDFLGPMSEYASEEEARKAGVDHAIEQLEHHVTPLGHG